MALIVYPTTDYDSFITVAEADTIIGNLTLNLDTWNALEDTSKEAYLRIAFQVIIDGLETIPDDPVSTCLKNSQALNAVHDLTNGVSNPIVVDQAVKKEEVGQVSVEYFAPDETSLSQTYIHPLSVACLTDLGYVFPITGFTQITLGRS